VKRELRRNPPRIKALSIFKDKYNREIGLIKMGNTILQYKENIIPADA
jgi:hypothetical protein